MACVTLLRACQFEIVRCNIYVLIWKHSSCSQRALGEDDDLYKKLSKKIWLGMLDSSVRWRRNLLCAHVRDKWNFFHILRYLHICGNKLRQRPRAWTPSKLFKWNKIIALISNFNERHGSRQGDFGMSWLVKFFLVFGGERFWIYKTLNINNYLYRKTFTGLLISLGILTCVGNFDPNFTKNVLVLF